MLNVVHSLVLRYGVAILAVSLVLLIQKPLEPVLGQQTPFFLFFAVITFSAWCGGWRLGVLCTAIATLLTSYFYLPPSHSIAEHSLEQNAHLGFFALEGLLISGLSSAMYKARQQAQTTVLEAQEYQETTRQTQERYRLLVECIKDYAIFMLDPNGTIISWNAGAERFFGYKTEEILGQHFSVFYSAEERDRRHPAQELEIARQEGCFENTELRVRRDGSHFWADIVITPLRDENQQLRGFSKVTHDVTERKWVEEALRRAVHSTRRYAAQLRGLTEAALAMNSTLSLEQMLQVLTDQARLLVGTHQASICVFLDEAQERTLQAFSFSSKYADWHTEQTSLDNVAQFRALTRQLQVSVHLTQDEITENPLWQDLQITAIHHPPLRGLLAAPLKGRSNQNIGLILLSDKCQGEFTENDEAIIVQLAQIASVSIENLRLYRAAQEAEAQLRHQLQFTSTITKSLGEGVYALDCCGYVTFINPAGEQMLGWTAAELLGHKIHEKIQIPETPDAPEDFNPLLGVLQMGKTLRKDDDLFVRKDGTRFPVAYTASPIMADGKVTGAVVAFHDISDRKQAEAEYARLLQGEQVARAEAETANRAKDEFLATLSHELRTPLNSMLGWARLLRTRHFDQKTTSRALETIERNAKLQAQLIEDILDVSRIIRGKLQLYVRPVLLEPVISAAINSVRLAAEAKSIQLTCNLDNRVGPVLGDPDRLHQVIWNLLSNAIKFTPSGGQVDVQLSVVRSEELGINEQTFTHAILKPIFYAQVQVSDTGIGIPPDFLPFVFDRFRQADSTSTRPHGGLGLGLSIVRHLIELHGGIVNVTSDGEGQGATFAINLPLMALQRETYDFNHSLPRIGEWQPDNTGAGVLNGLEVLVVDDEEDARELVATVLQQYGAKVIAVDSTRAAIATLTQSQPDVLVSDIAMPNEDGYTLIRQVKSLEAWQAIEIPAIALTAYAREEDGHRAIAAGFRKHLAKPIEPMQLVAAVAKMAGRLREEGQKEAE